METSLVVSEPSAPSAQSNFFKRECDGVPSMLRNEDQYLFLSQSEIDARLAKSNSSENGFADFETNFRNFRDLGLKWFLENKSQGPSCKVIPAEELKTAAFPNPSRPYAFYLAGEPFNGGCQLNSLYRGTHTSHRPDLTRILLTTCSKNLGNPDAYNVLRGDVIIVYSLRRRDGKTEKDLEMDPSATDVEGIFWEVDEHEVYKRVIEYNVPIMSVDFNDRDGEKKTLFIHKDWHTVVLPNAGADQRNIVVGAGPRRCFFQGNIFYPFLPAEFFGNKNGARWIDNPHNFTLNLPVANELLPVAVTLKQLPEIQEDQLNAAHGSHKGNSDDEEEFGRSSVVNVAVNAMAHFSRCAEVALMKKGKDNMLGEIVKITSSKSSITMEFRLDHRVETEWLWIILETHQSRTMKITEVREIKDYFYVKAQMKKKQWTGLPPAEHLLNKTALVTEVHCKLNPIALNHVYGSYPCATLLKAIGGKILKENCEFLNAPLPDDDSRTPQEADYMRRLLNKNDIVLATGASGLQAGKLMAKAAEMMSENDQESTHLLAAKSNMDAVWLVEQCSLLAGNTRIVRLNTANLLPAEKTAFDMEELWPRTFRDYVLKVDRSLGKDGTTDFECPAISAMHHLLNRGLIFPDELESEFLYSFANRQIRLNYSIKDAFFKIYKPQVIIGTVKSLNNAFANNNIIVEKVKSIQIYAAHELAKHDILEMVSWFHKARFAFLGDHRLASEFAKYDLPEALGLDGVFRRLVENNPSHTVFLDSVPPQRYESNEIERAEMPVAKQWLLEECNAENAVDDF